MSSEQSLACRNRENGRKKFVVKTRFVHNQSAVNTFKWTKNFVNERFHFWLQKAAVLEIAFAVGKSGFDGMSACLVKLIILLCGHETAQAKQVLLNMIVVSKLFLKGYWETLEKYKLWIFINIDSTTTYAKSNPKPLKHLPDPRKFGEYSDKST